MKDKKSKHLGITLDPELHFKIRYISNYYCRSTSRQIRHFIRQAIVSFEKIKGEIKLSEDLNDD